MMRQTIAMSKAKVSRTSFNFDEWVNAVPTKEKTKRVLFNENQIRISIKKHKKKENTFIISFAFREKILNLLDNNTNPKIKFFKHKDDDKRILLTRSENGYSVARPGNADYYFIKGNIYSEKSLNECSIIVDPIFHVKGKNSGSVIEVKIND